MSGLFNDDTLSLYLKLKEAMKQYVRDAMPGGVLNREIKPQDTLDAAALSLSPVPLVGDAAGLLADGYRYATDPSSRTPLNYGLSALGALPFVPAMGAVTAWHGSPHKFDKFDLSKIGTGEGAQAYGHGLYLAESPEVAQTYQQFGSWQHRANGQAQPVMFKDAPVQFDKMGNVVGDHPKGLKMFLSRVASKGDYDAALNEVKQTLADMKASGSFPSIQDDLAEEIAQATANKARIKASGAQGNLYKTDVPDEAVARFLDWDKPLSEQADVLKNLNDALVLYPFDAKNGQELYQAIARNNHPMGGRNAPTATSLLNEAGIPGIRYLDGGSRGAGTGTSNFVVFDPDMIRILERNGEATGAKPWQPGEWEGLFKK